MVWRWIDDVRTEAVMAMPAWRPPSAPAVEKTREPKPAAPTVSSAKKRRAPAPLAEIVKVQVEILHHFSGGRASIWMDDQLVFEQVLHGDDQRHPLFKTVEMNQTASFQFPAGKHLLQIRVVSPEIAYDQIETVNVNLAAGSEHVLQVNCDKRKMQVALQ